MGQCTSTYHLPRALQKPPLKIRVCFRRISVIRDDPRNGSKRAVGYRRRPWMR